MFKPSGRRSRRVSVVSALVLVAAGAAWGGGPVAVGASAADGATDRVSVSSTETQSNGGSLPPLATSSDGRFVAFTSDAYNLVDGDTNEAWDVFVRDRTTGTTSLVSVSSEEAQGNIDSGGGAISADGRYVAFQSQASNLVPGDSNGRADVFVRDRTTGTTRRVSVSSSERQAIYPAGLPSGHASISADGRHVAFASGASNLVSGDTNRRIDVFVRDRWTGTTRRVSVSSNQTQANRRSDLPQLSADGQYVAFRSDASNLVSGDTNTNEDVFVRSRATGTTRRVSVSSNETQGVRMDPVPGGPAISADGRYVAFHSTASNLVAEDTNGEFGVDVFVRDRAAGTTQLVSVNSNEAQGDDFSADPSISADGQRVAFRSAASNLVDGDTGQVDIFVRDQGAGTTSRASVSSGGTPANSSCQDGENICGYPEISGDGRHVAFITDASNLVPGDTNGLVDTFVRDFAP